jgi:hypothetical protein
MKLTKKNARRLKAIQKALASGKGLGGLLVGLAAATVVGGCDRPPFATAGIPANFHNEEPDVFVTEGEVPELQEPAATNAVNETEGTTDSPKVKEVIQVPVPNTNAVNETRDSALMVRGELPVRK